MTGERRGAGDAARSGALVTYLAFLLVVGVAVAGFVFIAMYRWRRGAVTIGGALLLAAGLRAALPDRAVGLLAIRSRAIDVLAYTAFGLALVGIAVTID